MKLEKKRLFLLLQLELLRKTCPLKFWLSTSHLTFNYVMQRVHVEISICTYPASDRNLEICLAETNTICSDIMLPSYSPPPRDLLTRHLNPFHVTYTEFHIMTLYMIQL